MKLKYWLVALSAIITLVLLICLIGTNNNIININKLWQYNNTINTSNQTNIDDNLNNNSTTIIDPFYIPPNDYVINNISWSKYPNLQKGYVLEAEKSEPTDVLNYEFINVQICTEIKDTDNETLIKEQLSGVAKEVKAIYGPISSICIAGTRGGAAEYFAEIWSYNDTVLLY